MQANTVFLGVDQIKKGLNIHIYHVRYRFIRRVFHGVCQPLVAYSQEEVSCVIGCDMTAVYLIPYTSEPLGSGCCQDTGLGATWSSEHNTSLLFLLISSITILFHEFTQKSLLALVIKDITVLLLLADFFILVLFLFASTSVCDHSLILKYKQ